MGRLILDQEAFGLSSLMERISRVKVKDCFKDEDTVYFIVGQGELWKALGKDTINVKRLQEKLGKRVRVIEYRDNVISFVKNIIYPIKVEEIIEENGVIFIKDSSKKTKSVLIGRNSKNLKLINRAVKRFFNKEVKVV